MLALRLLATLVLFGCGLWGVGLMLFRVPAVPFALPAAITFALAAIAGLWGVWSNAPRLPLGFAVLFLGLLGWWNGLTPSHRRDWIPEVARLPTITREGERITVANLRNFAWRGETEAEERWETRGFDLTTLEGVDLFLGYWSGEDIAHLILSFPFSGGVPLAVSVEVRREKGEDWAALAGFFRSYELAYVVADERDVIGLRSHVRKEDVRLFRLRASPAQARDVLLAYAQDINRLATEPRWYNTLFTNCTTVVYRLVATVAPGWRFSLPLDPRVVLSGHLPGYLRDIGAVSADPPLADLVARSRISERARAVALDDPAFSARIREGLPAARP